MADIEAGKVSVVIAWALDRLQRNRRDEVRLYETCQRRGVVLSLVNGADLDFSTAAGRFVADSLGSVARLEVEMKSDRQRRAVQQRVSQGKRSGGRRPFGYAADGLAINAVEARAMREVYARFLAGVPLGGIARWLNDAGVPTTQERWGAKQGEPALWTRDTVRRVLANPRNAGLMSYKGVVTGQAEWSGIVPEETWRAAVHKITEAKRPGTVRPSPHLLSGLALCGVCGEPVHAGGGARPGVPSYRCRGSMGHVSRMAEPVDEYVVAVVLERLSRPDARELLHEPEAKPDAGALREEATVLRARLESVAIEFADGVVSAAQLRTITERINEQQTKVEQALSDAGRVNVLGPLLSADDLAEKWNALPMGQRRAIIGLLMTVTVHPPGRGVRTFRPESVGIDWERRQR